MKSMNYTTMKVYGRSLTEHHKQLILSDMRDFAIQYSMWLHLAGVELVPHEEWCPRYYKFPDGTILSADRTVAKFLSSIDVQIVDKCSVQRSIKNK